MTFIGNERGFSLLELTTAIAVAGVMILTCGLVMKVGMNDGQSLEEKLSMERDIEFFLEQLEDDLASVFGHHWHEGNGSDSCLYAWFSLKPIGAQSQDQAINNLCAVGYTLSEDDGGFDGRHGQLLRQQKDSLEVFRSLASGRRRDLWQLSVRAEPVMEGVLVFELWPLIRDDESSWQLWHPELREMPDALDLCMVVATPSLRVRLHGAQQWEQARTRIDDLSPAEIRKVRTLIELGSDVR
ncbi:MAG: PulJ/GspJ family protein [Luteolibacter sp.]